MRAKPFYSSCRLGEEKRRVQNLGLKGKMEIMTTWTERDRRLTDSPRHETNIEKGSERNGQECTCPESSKSPSSVVSRLSGFFTVAPKIEAFS